MMQTNDHLISGQQLLLKKVSEPILRNSHHACNNFSNKISSTMQTNLQSFSHPICESNQTANQRQEEFILKFQFI